MANGFIERRTNEYKEQPLLLLPDFLTALFGIKTIVDLANVASAGWAAPIFSVLATGGSYWWGQEMRQGRQAAAR